jgi:hypothetical protein
VENNMGMEDYHCHALEVSLRLPAKDFDKQALLADIENAVSIEELDVFNAMCSSLERKGKEHAEISIRFLPSDRVSVGILYHRADFEFEDMRPPHMEDCAQWLAGFIKSDEVKADMRAMFEFDKRYSSIIALPFPILTDRAELSGALITGVSIQFPMEVPLKGALMQRDKNGITIRVRTTEKLRLKEFELNAALNRLIKPVMMLVKKEEEK